MITELMSAAMMMKSSFSDLATDLKLEVDTSVNVHRSGWQGHLLRLYLREVARVA
jgi:hypothetical protein